MSSITQDHSDVAPWKRTRYVMVALLTSAIAIAFAAKFVMSIAIVAMIDRTVNTDFETFDWDLSEQSTILSSAFWGYVPTVIPSGILLQRYGIRWLLLGSVLLSAVATVVTPAVASSFDWTGVCVLRVFLGVIQAVLIPAFGSLFATWATPAEYGTIGSILFSGSLFADVLSMSVGGALASSSGGWPSIFYCFGALCFAWCIVWFFLGFDSPESHPYISQEEKLYIMSFYKNRNAPSFKTPWLQMATSLPVWSLAISSSVYNWGYFMILNESPTYMKNVLHYNIKDNGTLSAMPYVVMLILTFFFGGFSDFLIRKNKLSIIWTRRLFNTIGFAGPMLAMIGLGYVGEKEKDIAVALLIISCGLNSAVNAGFVVSPVEISRNFTSVLVASINTVAACISLVVPLITAAIVKDETNEENWQTLFWISGALYLVGSLVYLFFSSSELQPWDNVNSNKSSTIEA